MENFSYEQILEESRDQAFRDEVDQITESMPPDFKLSLKFRIKMWFIFQKAKLQNLFK